MGKISYVSYSGLEYEPYHYTYNDTGYNNNMYKLAVMLFSMDAQLFQRLYLDGGEDALIQTEKIDGVETGVFTAQTGDARAYWSKFTFLPSDVDGRVIGENWYHYWTKPDKWETYKTAGEITSDENQGYLNGRMFVFKGIKLPHRILAREQFRHRIRILSLRILRSLREMIPRRHRQMQSVIFSDIKHQRIMWMENCGYWILSHAMTERTGTR